MRKNYQFNFIKVNNKYPLMSNILKQVLFWIPAYVLLLFIIHHNTVSTFYALGRPIKMALYPLLIFAGCSGLFFGVALGLIDGVVRKIYHRNHALGISILAGGVFYFSVLMLLVWATRFSLLNFSDLMDLDPLIMELMLSQENSFHFNYILMVYTFLMTLVISFINQMTKKFGPGYLLPILLGRFRYPREEERIFMFLDLRSSTTLAEELGHIKYSALIRQAFLDINRVVKKFHGEIYQYVGDEVVVSWPVEALENFATTEFFFGVQKQLEARREYYLQKFGVQPSFKAGVHLGLVTMVEVGEVKRDIAYHGDTLNVAARLEGLCSELKQSVLISGDLVNRGKLNDKYKLLPFGWQKLKGRELPLEVFGLLPL